jgi:hypothetical protein
VIDALVVERARYGDIMTTALSTAEAEAARWKELHADRVHDLQHEYARANTAEAEVERLRMELAEANAETEAAQNALIHLEDAMNGACALDEAERAQAEVARLRAVTEGARVLLLRAGPHIPGSEPIRKQINAWLQANPRFVVNSGQDAR